MRGRAKVPLILYFGTRQRLAVSYNSGLQYSRERSPDEWASEPSIRFRTDKNLVPLLRM